MIVLGCEHKVERPCWLNGGNTLRGDLALPGESACILWDVRVLQEWVSEAPDPTTVFLRNILSPNCRVLCSALPGLLPLLSAITVAAGPGRTVRKVKC